LSVLIDISDIVKKEYSMTEPIRERFRDSNVFLLSFHFLCDKILIMFSLLMRFSFIFIALFLKHNDSSSVMPSSFGFGLYGILSPASLKSIVLLFILLLNF
jgi:hypothetical protein